MIERIFRNPKSTILGLLLLIFGGVLVWFEKASLTEYSAFIVGGLALMMSTDGKDNNGGKENLKGQKKVGQAHEA